MLFSSPHSFVLLRGTEMRWLAGALAVTLDQETTLELELEGTGVFESFVELSH